MATAQNPVFAVNIPIPTRIGSKMGGEVTYQPKWDPIGFDPQPYHFVAPSFVNSRSEALAGSSTRQGAVVRAVWFWVLTAQVLVMTGFPGEWHAAPFGDAGAHGWFPALRSASAGARGTSVRRRFAGAGRGCQE